MDDELDEAKAELRDEIRLLREDIRREVLSAIRGAGGESIKVELGRSDVEQTEPSSVVAKDLVKLIRENVRSSLVERGERAVDDLVGGMPEDSAAELLKSLANTERLKIVKLLYLSDKTFSDLKNATALEGASVSHHLKSLLGMGLISHGDEGGYQLTKRGRLLVRTLALMNEALGGEKVD
ncbi:MAG: winged helix-turn-helix domain-containing protein [Nitrososphaerales archaeon]